MAKGLGRGLDSLLGILDDEKPVNNTKNDKKLDDIDKKEGVIDINMSLIDNNPAQPRKNFDPTALQELATSIKNFLISTSFAYPYAIVMTHHRCKITNNNQIIIGIMPFTDIRYYTVVTI